MSGAGGGRGCAWWDAGAGREHRRGASATGRRQGFIFPPAPPPRPSPSSQKGITLALTEEREKNSDALGRLALFKGTSVLEGLPPVLTVQMMRFFYKVDVRQKAKILRKVRRILCVYPHRAGGMVAGGPGAWLRKGAGGAAGSRLGCASGSGNMPGDRTSPAPCGGGGAGCWAGAWRPTACARRQGAGGQL